MPYRDYLRDKAPRWLKGEIADGKMGRVWWEEIGQLADDVTAREKEAVKVCLPSAAPADALPYLGSELTLERGPTESEADFRARLAAPWTAHRHAGSGYGILTQLRAIGYTSTNGDPTIVQQNGLALSLDAAGALVKTLLGPNPAIGGNMPLVAGTTEWWTFDSGLDANGDQYNGRFALLFPSLPSGWTTPTDPPVAAPTLAEVNTIRRFVNRWREGARRFMGIYVLVGGIAWGWPPDLEWGDAGDWGDGDVIAWGPEET